MDTVLNCWVSSSIFEMIIHPVNRNVILKNIRLKQELLAKDNYIFVKVRTFHWLEVKELHYHAYQRKSCLCCKARFPKKVVAWTIHPFVITNPRILIKGTQMNIEQKNPYSLNHLQKGALDLGKSIAKSPLNLQFFK